MWDWLIKTRRKTTNNALILMYHRVAELRYDPWNLAVTPACFRDQIKYLKTNHAIVCLSDLQQAISDGVKNPIAITFDDGYADNYQVAGPILTENSVPATFFICTGNIESGNFFWWDALQQILLEAPVLPSELQLCIANETVRIDLIGEETLKNEQSENYARWRYPQQPPGKRGIAYMEIWKMLKKNNPDEQLAVLERLKEWSGQRGGNLEEYRVLSEKELKDLSVNPLFRIGAHTVNHPSLSQYSASLQINEIRDSKKYLENLISTTITDFAFPFGDYNKQTSNILRSENFTTAVTTVNGLVKKDTDPLQFGRYLVKNVSGNLLIQEINKQLAEN